MATILLAWELGGGLGHLINLMPFARGLTERGHSVVAVLKNISQAEKIMGGPDIRFFQAPIMTRAPVRKKEPVRNFAQLLFNNGFCDADELKTTARKWRNLYESVKPELIILDHSPTALLAARSYTAKRAIIGTGFFCPINKHPLPDIRPWLPNAKEQLLQDENMVKDIINQVLSSWGLITLETLSQLYHEVDEQFFVTFPELDHYGVRPGARYWGAWPNVGGKKPSWPDGYGKRIYAYLKPFPALPVLLNILNDLEYPTIVYGNELDNRILRKQFQAKTLCFEDEWLDLSEVGRQCDVAILNGNHGTTVSFLLAGRPTLQIPLFLEQGLFSVAIERLGAGIVALPDKPEEFFSRLTTLLNYPQYYDAAAKFARRYAEFDPHRQIDALLKRAEELLSA